jgi:hypothetical protein
MTIKKATQASNISNARQASSSDSSNRRKDRRKKRFKKNVFSNNICNKFGNEGALGKQTSDVKAAIRSVGYSEIPFRQARKPKYNHGISYRRPAV